MSATKKPVTHVLFVTDRSWSMHDVAPEVRSGFNAYVDELRADKERKYRLSLVLFNHDVTQVCVNTKLRDTPRLDQVSYSPIGNTALLDAVGYAVTNFERQTTLADRDRVLVVVQTDGRENCSRAHTKEQITAMIKEREATGQWSFVFLGAGPTAWHQAGGMGFDGANIVRTADNPAGYRITYSALGRASNLFARGATGQSVAATVAAAVNAEPDPKDEVA